MLFYHISLYVFNLSNIHFICIICISRTLVMFVQNSTMSVLPFVNNMHVCSLICYFCHICKVNTSIEYYGIWPSITFLNNLQWSAECTYQSQCAPSFVKSTISCRQFQQRCCKATNEVCQNVRLCQT